jgi:uncharacterized membrane protein YdjX (TVP38/TMEM64 family)
VRRIGPHARLAVFVLALGFVFFLVAVVRVISVDDVRRVVEGAGAVAPILFIVCSAVASCVFVPGPLLAGLSGVLFGTALGTPVSLASAILATVLAMTLSRFVARDAAEEALGDHLVGAREFIERRGFVAVLYARIAPGMPFTLVNYMGGLTRVSVTTFALATLIGSSPRAFAYTALGGSLDDLSSPEAIVALSIIGAMAVVGLALLVRDRRRVQVRRRINAREAALRGW